MSTLHQNTFQMCDGTRRARPDPVPVTHVKQVRDPRMRIGEDPSLPPLVSAMPELLRTPLQQLEIAVFPRDLVHHPIPWATVSNTPPQHL